MTSVTPANKNGELRHGKRLAIAAMGLLVLGILCLDHWRQLTPLDDLAYDTCYPWQNRWRDLPIRVLLVDATGHPSIWSDQDELVRLVERLKALGARRVGIALEGPIAPLSETISESVVTGRSVIRVEEDPTQWRLSNRETLVEPSGRWGCFGAATSRHGMCRAYRLSYPNRAGPLPSFEAVLTEGLRDVSDARHWLWEAEGSERIRYCGGVGSLPHVSAEFVLDDQIVPELVADRVVLVGGSPEAVLRELYTPTAASMQGMRLLEIQGHTVNTLLTDSCIHAMVPIWRAVLILLVALIGFVVYARCGTRIGFVITMVAGGLLVVASVFALARFDLWLPLVQMVLVLVGSFGIVFARRVEYSRTALNHLLFDLSTRIWQRSWPTAFFSQEDPWPEVISFVRQTLDLNRLIILDLPSTRHHVAEVNAFNCSLADIQEMRRDIRRWPYTEAVAGAGPYQIDVVKRPFLCPLDTSEPGKKAAEDQYLVPLRFAGELFGFLAVGMLSERIRSRKQFEERLGDIAEQTAELLYRRRYVFEQQNRHANPFSMLGRLPEENAFAELSQATHLLERRLSRFEQIFNESGVSTAIYDLFGQLMMANTRMHDLLRRAGANVDDMTTVDLLCRLTERGVDEVRELLGRVIVQKHCESLAIELDEERGSYMLHVRPLVLSLPSPDETDSEATPFEIQGILCELVDRSSAVELYRLKDNLTETLGHSLRNDLGAVELATSLITDQRVDPESRDSYEAIVHAKVSESAELLREARGLLLCTEDDDLTDCVPLDPHPLLQRAIRGVGDDLEARRLSVNVIRPELTSHAFAVPGDLHRMFVAILSVLIQDAHEGTELEIRTEEQMGEVVFHFVNEGFGVSTKNLSKALKDTNDTEQFAPLRDQAKKLDMWGSKLVASGSVGEGIELSLSLRRFS